MAFNCENYGCDKTFVSRAGKWKHKQKCEMQGRKIQDATKDWSKSENGTFKCSKCTKLFTQLVNFYRQTGRLRNAGRLRIYCIFLRNCLISRNANYYEYTIVVFHIGTQFRCSFL